MKKLYAALFVLVLTFSLAACKAELTSIEVNADSVHKTEYYMGDAFSSEGLYINAVYSKGSKQILDASDDNITITGFNSSWPATAQKINISYKGKTEIFKASYSITIKAKTNAGYSAHYDNNVLFQYPSSWTKLSETYEGMDLTGFTDAASGTVAGYTVIPYAIPMIDTLPQSAIEALFAEALGETVSVNTFERITFAGKANTIHMEYTYTLPEAEAGAGTDINIDIYLITYNSSTYMFVFGSEAGNSAAAAAFTAVEGTIQFRD